MINILFSYILPTILAATPISLIIIEKYNKYISRNNPKLGETTVICTNIANVLTKDYLFLRSIYYDQYKIRVDENKPLITINNLETQNKKELKVEPIHLKQDELISIISTILTLTPFEKTERIEETALNFLKKCGFNKQKITQDYNIIQKVPFPDKKNFSTTVARNKETKEIFAFTKGNALQILKKCTRTIINGKKIELDSQNRRKIRKNIKKLIKNGEKVIGFAYKPLPFKKLESYSEQFTENESIFIGMIGTINPVRTNLDENIQILKQAKIKTYIVTAAKEKKSVAIGKILNLVNPQYFEAITGDYFSQLNESKINKIIKNKEKDYVFVEMKKKHKQRLYELLKNNSETVAVVNNKQKNGFNELVDGIKKGRIITKNRIKYHTHAISCKIAELMLLILSFILQAPLPLTISLIIIIDIFINLLLEFSLRANEINDDVMTPKYHAYSTKNLYKKALPYLLFNGITVGIFISFIYFWSLIKYGWTPGEIINTQELTYIKSVSITFILLGLIQILNTFIHNNPYTSILKNKLLKNIYIPLTSIVTILFLYFFTTFPVISNNLNLSTISSIEWKIIIYILINFILIDESRKYFLKRRKNEN